MERLIDLKLREWKAQKRRRPLILKGARQVGKTHSLKAFGQRSFLRTHYLNFEKEEAVHPIFKKDLNPERIVSELSFYLNQSIEEAQDLLIFDEIQECPQALTSLKYFAEEKPNLALCTAGSLLGIHLNESSFPVGKVDFLDLYPLSFIEFLKGIGDERSWKIISQLTPHSEISEVQHAHLWEQLKLYFVVGGLPESVEIFKEHRADLFAALNAVREKQSSLLLAYVADMAKHSGKVNAMHIERLLRHVPSQLARQQGGSVSRFRFKDIIPGHGRFEKLVGPIDWLQSAGLVLKIFITHSGELPFSAYIQENRFKLYLFDVGMLGAIAGLSPKVILDYDYGTYKGFFAENFVAQEFLAAGEKQLYAWSEKTAEIEFLREVDGAVFPIEVKSGWVTQSKSLGVFAAKYAPEYRTVFSANALKIDSQNKMHRYPLYLASSFPLARG